MKEKINKLWKIFITFFKIGAFTFGGGYAMIPLIQRETAYKNKWVSDDDILEIVAISESTPGPISINTATFIGYRVAGFLGAFCGTIGLVLPAFIIMLVVSTLLRNFQDNNIVQYAFQGIRAGVLALIISALYKMYKQVPKNLISYLIMIIALLLTTFLDINVIFVTIICAIIGLVSSIYTEWRKRK